MKPARLSFLVFAAGLLGHSQLFAQATWVGADLANWNVPTNWSGTAPVDNATSALTFNYASGNLTSTNGLTNLTVSSLTIASTSRDNTLNGNAITLAGTLSDATGSWQYLNLPIAISGNQTFAITNGRMYLNGTLSNGTSTGAITKTGGGWLLLAGNNSFIGSSGNSVTFSGGGSGRVVLTNPAALPSGAMVRFAGGGSGELELQTDTSASACNIGSGTGNGGTVIVNRASAGTSVSHTLGYVDMSSVTLTLDKGGNVSGNAAVSFTDLRLTGGNDTNPVTLKGSADITLGSASITSNAQSKRLQLDGTSANNLITGAVTDGIPGARVSLLKAGTSIWKISGSNIYTGSTTLTGGTLSLDQATLGNATTVTIASGAFLNLNYSATNIVGALTLNGAAQADGIYDSTNASGFITGSGKLQVVTTAVHAGADASLWSVPANWTGIVPVTGGTSPLTFVSQSNRTSTNDLANLAASSVNFPVGGRDNTLNGTNLLTLAGDVSVATGNYQTINMPLAITGSRNFNIANGRLTLNGIISDGATSGAITKLGGAPLFLGGANTLTGNGGNSLVFSGTNSGTVVLTHPAALGTAGKVVRFSAGGSGTLEFQTDTSVNAYSIASGTFNGGTITANRATAGTTISHALGTLDLSSVGMTINKGGNVSGSAAVSFTELKMSGGNDYNPVTVAGNADLMIGSASITANGQSKRLQLDGTSANNTIGAITNTNNGTPGASVSLIKGNSSTWTLTGINTYTGTTAVNNGTLKAGSTQALGTNSAVTLANAANAVLDLNSYSNSIGSLTGGGTTGGNVTLGAATLAIGGDLTSPAAYSGVISGTGSLVKNGTGTLALSGHNTYTGATLVTAGTLALVGGSHAAPISVTSGATLGFTLGSPTASSSTVTFSGTTAKVSVSGTPVAATLMSASNLIGTPVLEPAIPGYVLAVEAGGTQLNLKALPANNYNAWATANDATGQAANLDHDHDGVPNGIEYFLGGPAGITTGFTALPGITTAGNTRSVTWVKAASYTGVYGSDYVVETSTTLAAGSWTPEPTPGNVTVSGNNVTYTFPAGPVKQFARLNVTGP